MNETDQENPENERFELETSRRDVLVKAITAGAVAGGALAAPRITTFATGTAPAYAQACSSPRPPEPSVTIDCVATRSGRASVDGTTTLPVESPTGTDQDFVDAVTAALANATMAFTVSFEMRPFNVTVESICPGDGYALKSSFDIDVEGFFDQVQAELAAAGYDVPANQISIGALRVFRLATAYNHGTGGTFEGQLPDFNSFGIEFPTPAAVYNEGTCQWDCPVVDPTDLANYCSDLFDRTVQQLVGQGVTITNAAGDSVTATLNGVINYSAIRNDCSELVSDFEFVCTDETATKYTAPASTGQLGTGTSNSNNDGISI